jgi:hypothetical protein
MHAKSYPTDTRQNPRFKIHEELRRRHEVPKVKVGSVMQIPENAFDHLPMRSPWRRLKMSAQTYL